MFTSALLISFLTLVSRILGLIRELLIANFFGVSFLSDSINTALKLPNLFRRLFGEGALSSVFIPFYFKNPDKHFSNQIFSVLFFFLLILTLFFEVLMPLEIIAPGFKGEVYNITRDLCRITFPYVILVCISAFYGAILNAHNYFKLFAASPIILNIVFIITILLVEKDPLKIAYAIAYSTSIGGLVQLLILMYALKKISLLPSFTIKFDLRLKEFLHQFYPAVTSQSILQLNIFVSQSIASFVPGAVSIFSYADRIYQFPIAIIGVGISTVLLPNLSRLYAKSDFDCAQMMVKKTITVSMILTIPSSFGLYAIVPHLTHLIYERGEFSRADTYATSEAIQAFVIGLPAFILTKILLSIFQALKINDKIFKITLYTIILNIILNILLIKKFGAVGIALATSIAGWFNVIALMKSLRDQGHKITFDVNKILVSITASWIMYLTIKFIDSRFIFFESNYKIQIFLCLIIIPSIIYLLIIWIFKCFALD